MSRSGRRIDRPLLPASCPVCGHVVLRADGVSRAGATCWGQVSGNRCHYAAWAEPLRPFCRSLDGHVRWSLCRWTRPVGRPPLRTADVRHRCRITVGRPTHAAQRPSAMAALARTRAPWCPAAGRVDRWADTPTSIVCARAGAPITSPSWIVLPGVLPGLEPTGPWAYSSRRSVTPRSWVVVGALHQVERYPRATCSASPSLGWRPAARLENCVQRRQGSHITGVSPLARPAGVGGDLAPSRRRLQGRVGPPAVGGVEVDAGRDDLVDAVQQRRVQDDVRGGELAFELVHGAWPDDR
jgi:hypothetical protein